MVFRSFLFGILNEMKTIEHPAIVNCSQIKHSAKVNFKEKNLSFKIQNHIDVSLSALCS